MCEVARVKDHQSKSFIDVEALNEDKQVVGGASLSKVETNKTLLWLHELEVHPLCRRKGVGTAIMDHIVELAEKKGVELVYACPMPLDDAEGKAPTEKQLRAFYKRQGFEPCDAPKDIVTVTDEGLVKRGMCLTVK